MKTLLLLTTTLLLLNVSVMAEGMVGATQTDCSDMSDITGADSPSSTDSNDDLGGGSVIRT
tara:strand:- start:272 stop:454 length:183 start_codon:yes stop_codon:yes gene_type:complete